MAHPDIKMIAVSNVFSRLMYFKNAGDVELGHTHSYDHATLISAGSVCVDVFSADGTVESSRNFVAPDMIFIQKDKFHKLTSLQDNTVCACIHALRTVDEEIVDPNFLVDALQGGDGQILKAVQGRYGQPMQCLTTSS
jgi:hypothetical protein